MKKIKLYFLLSFLLFVVITSVAFYDQGNNRQLTKNEILELHSVFYNQVNYSKVTLVTTNLPPSLAAIVLGNIILYREEYHIDDFSSDYLKMGRLIHEIGHVWANQTYGLHTSVFAVYEQLKYGDQVYVYGSLTEGKPLNNFRYEQQCQILSDYYINRYLGNDVTSYESTIYKTIIKPLR